MISIIIPAHNEARAIVHSLHALLPGATSGELEVIVVCNGCSDDTARVVAEFGPAIRCLETPIASKTHALNLGDEAASGFPRFYLDADVLLTPEAVRQVAEILKSGPYLAAAPKFRMDFTDATWPVRAYYDIWQRLPYVQEGMIGAGVYALSAAGRQRFGRFPEVIADDGYVRALFKGHERTVVAGCEVMVRAPRTLPGLIKIKTRSRLGGYQLFRDFPELLKNEDKAYGSALKIFLPRVWLWPPLAVYLLVNLYTRLRAKRQLPEVDSIGWERDESSRA